MPSSKYTMKKTNSSGYLLLLVFLVLMAGRPLSIRYHAQAFLEENVYKGGLTLSSSKMPSYYEVGSFLPLLRLIISREGH
ncbi:hypothetical protein MUK42_29399 [Musa troglodytarum]|uniref:Uncharacterized protein n=1 Tax=Musa troglodytarum TaxID=320322 RepID=A0A9E7FLZ1_9LILI|nr:hypothetical protein MUK42_29399 [Musa troglodytarum]